MTQPAASARPVLEFDTSWASLTRPGDAGDFFYRGPLREFRPPPLDPGTGAFSLVTAWWLSEMCRLVYRQGPDELGPLAPVPGRADFLAEVGFHEPEFVNGGSAQCAVFRSLAPPEITILAFRGTDRFGNWLSNLTAIQVEWSEGGQVHWGFKREFYQIWPQLRDRIEEMSGPVFYTGHSLGGAMALLAASLRPPDALYTFGAPRVGDAAFSASLQSFPIHRVVNQRDIVPLVPPSRIPFDFEHVGELHHLQELDGPSPEAVFPNGVGMLEGLRSLTLTPEFLTDHSPVNYSLHLTRRLWSADRATSATVRSGSPDPLSVPAIFPLSAPCARKSDSP